MSMENNALEQPKQKIKRKNFLAEIFLFMWKQKAYWIFPVIIFLILLIFLIAIGSSPVSPFIYTII